MDAPESNEWDGLRRGRWMNRYALLFTLTVGPSTALFLSSTQFGRYGRGHEVRSVVIGIFVFVVVATGVFLARLLAWRLGQNARRAVMIVTIALGVAAVAWSWTIFQAHQRELSSRW